MLRKNNCNNELLHEQSVNHNKTLRKLLNGENVPLFYILVAGALSLFFLPLDLAYLNCMVQVCTTYGRRAACGPRNLLLRPSKISPSKWRKQFVRLLKVPKQKKVQNLFTVAKQIFSLFESTCAQYVNKRSR